ncbi:MAG TPA: CPBP family glutamic-type intramembrane protease [Mucilaginibacter sp.]
MHLLSAVVPTCIFLLVTLFAIFFTRVKIDANFLLLAFTAIGYAFLLNLPRNFQELQFVNSRWNWSGKIFATLFAFGCIAVFKNRLSSAKVGLTTTFLPASFRPCLVFTAGYLFVICAGSFLFQGKLPHSMSTDDILWNTTVLPDFSEELMERGILLLLLDHIFSKEWLFFNAKIGPGMLLVCLLFGFEHGLMVNYQFRFTFDAFSFFRTFFISALAFTWLKERSGNLIFPTIAHFGTEMILTIIITIFF